MYKLILTNGKVCSAFLIYFSLRTCEEVYTNIHLKLSPIYLAA